MTTNNQTEALKVAREVPEGYVLVPKEPTEEMHVAAVRTITRCTGNDDFPPRVWRAMIAAAPVAQAVPDTAQPQDDERQNVTRMEVFKATQEKDLLGAMKLIEQYALIAHAGSGIAGMLRDAIVAAQTAPAVPDTAIPELRNIQAAKMTSDFTVELRFPSCRSASAFKIALAAISATNPDDKRGSEG